MFAAAPPPMQPTWLRVPAPEAVAKYYPPVAAALGLEDEAMVRCVVNAEGRLTNCDVVRETPLGHGFARAAVGMATSLMRMKTITQDGKPTAGGVVSIPFIFRPPGGKRGVPTDVAVKCYASVSQAQPASAYARAIEFWSATLTRNLKAARLNPDRIEALLSEARTARVDPLLSAEACSDGLES